jgi:hypothetical protein
MSLTCVYASSGRTVDAPFQKIAARLRDIDQSRHRSRLVDPAELPPRERAARKVDEFFWRHAASGDRLPDQKVKRRKMQVPGSKRKRKTAPFALPPKRFEPSTSSSAMPHSQLLGRRDSEASHLFSGVCRPPRLQGFASSSALSRRGADDNMPYGQLLIVM